VRGVHNRRSGRHQIVESGTRARATQATLQSSYHNERRYLDCFHQGHRSGIREGAHIAEGSWGYDRGGISRTLTYRQQRDPAATIVISETDEESEDIKNSVCEALFNAKRLFIWPHGSPPADWFGTLQGFLNDPSHTKYSVQEFKLMLSRSHHIEYMYTEAFKALLSPLVSVQLV
jgi:hypothetical protein